MAISVLKTNTKLDVMRGGGARFVENLKIQLCAGEWFQGLISAFETLLSAQNFKIELKITAERHEGILKRSGFVLFDKEVTDPSKKVSGNRAVKNV